MSWVDPRGGGILDLDDEWGRSSGQSACCLTALTAPRPRAHCAQRASAYSWSEQKRRECRYSCAPWICFILGWNIFVVFLFATSISISSMPSPCIRVSAAVLGLLPSVAHIVVDVYDNHDVNLRRCAPYRSAPACGSLPPPIGSKVPRGTGKHLSQHFPQHVLQLVYIPSKGSPPPPLIRMDGMGVARLKRSRAT